MSISKCFTFVQLHLVTHGIYLTRGIYLTHGNDLTHGNYLAHTLYPCCYKLYNNCHMKNSITRIFPIGFGMEPHDLSHQECYGTMASYWGKHLVL